MARKQTQAGRKDTADPLTELAAQNFDIEIKADGRWFHEGGEIKRLGLVKLFASVLSCDADGRYWLTTPAEHGEIQVEDAPFIITGLRCEGTGQSQLIFVRDNIDREYLLGKAHPLILQKRLREGADGDMKPYVMLEKGLSALVKHAVFYEMAEIAIAHNEGEAEAIRLWSDGVAFSLEAL